MCDRLVPPADESDPVVRFAPNLLQLTSATFLVPGAVCVAQGRLVGVSVHCGNAVCSVYVHRPNRTAVDNAGDIFDHFFVAMWVCYNTYILACERPASSAFAVGCAVCVACAKVWTKCLKYRSLQRYAVHACMHVFGTLGSMALLL